MAPAEELEEKDMVPKGTTPARRGSASSVTSKGPEYFSLMEDDDYDEVGIQGDHSRTTICCIAFYVSVLLCAIVGIAGAAWWGVQIGARQQLRQLEGSSGGGGSDSGGTDAGKCIVDVSLGKSGEELELQRLSGEKTSISLRHDSPAEAQNFKAMVEEARPSPARESFDGALLAGNVKAASSVEFPSVAGR